MSWQKEVKKWREGRIDQLVPRETIFSWLKEDSIWQNADKIEFNEGGGSHLAKVFVKDMDQVLPKWSGGVLDVSVTGRHVKKWIVEQLVKGYEQLEMLD